MLNREERSLPSHATGFRFSGTALALVLATMVGGSTFGAIGFFMAEAARLTNGATLVFWSGLVLTMVYAGALVGVVTRRAPWLETTVALTVAAVPVVLLLGGTDLWAAQAAVAMAVGILCATAGGWVAKQWFEQGLVAWLLTQIGIFLWLLLQMLGVGIGIAIVEKRISWPAFFAACGIILVGVGGIAAAVFMDSTSLYGMRELGLWCGSMAVMLFAGFVAGRLARSVAYWEIELATVLLATLIFVHLKFDVAVLLGMGPADNESFLGYFSAIEPGVRLFGPMWVVLVLLGTGAGFLLAVFGGSIAFIFYGDTGSFDGRFDFEWFVGSRHLFGHKVSTTAVVAVLGVALGVASLIAVTAVMSGYQEDIQTKILSTNAHFVVQKYGVDFTEYDEVAAKGLSHEEVLAGTPFTFNEAMLSTGKRGLGVLLKGVVPETAGTVTGIEENLCKVLHADGRCERYDSEELPMLPEILRPRNGVPMLVLGSELFKKVGLPIGAHVSVTTPVGIAGARGNAPRRLEFGIAGAFRSGMHDFDARLVYLDVRSSQKLMGLASAVNGVEFRIKDPERVDVVASEVLRVVGRYPYRTLGWRELNAGIFSALKYQKIVMFLVLTFIIIVAAFNIASTLFMAVVEKSREIAVLKSMGGRDGSVMKIFVLEGWFVGGVGTALGVLLGLLVCVLISRLEISIAADVYMVESLGVKVQFLEVAFTAFAAFAISHLATIYPSLKAARERPVDGMRHD